MQHIKQYVEQNRQRFLDELFELLRFPSISADPAYKADVLNAAAYVAKKLADAGADKVEVCETAGNPIVYGEKIIDPFKPTVLVYGHYDVQPPDPLDLWKTGPFEPTVRDSNLYARGAADNKGMVVAVIQAVEALVNTNGGRPPVNLAFFFEGEEEIGSPTVPALVRGNLDKLKC